MMIHDVAHHCAENGIAVAVRSLKGANPTAAANVTLLSKSNDALATAVTDASGYAQFNKDAVSGRGAMAPAAVAVTSGQDAFVLSLDGDGLALKDAKSTRPAHEGTSLQACAWTSRGIYRPGETVHYTALVRNKDLTATDLKALTLRISRPDGTAVKSLTLDARGAGFFEGEYRLPEEGERGAWTFTLRAGEHADIAHAAADREQDDGKGQKDYSETASRGILACPLEAMRSTICGHSSDPWSTGRHSGRSRRKGHSLRGPSRSH